MKTIIKNKFIEYNFIIFPIWIGIAYFFIKTTLIKNDEIVFLIFLILFGETHFASTYLFYLDKKNLNYIKNKIFILVYIPLFLVLAYIIIGIFSLKIAILIGAIASGIHVTRQSVGIQKLYSQEKKIFFEYITYIASSFFLIIGFIRFYLPDYISNFWLNIDFVNKNININFYYLLLVLLFSLIAFLEKTNIKKRLVNLSGVLIYAPYLFVNNIYDAIIIGVGAHWCQYLGINYKVYLYNYKLDLKKIFIISFILLYSLTMSVIGYVRHFNYIINYLILIPLAGQFFHYYVDAFIWKFSEKHIRDNIGYKLFSA